MTVFSHQAVPGLATVIVLNHNGAAIMHLIRKSMEAIVAQGYEGGLELVIVDDNSTDGSDQQIAALCEEFLATFCSTCNGNHGISAARNAGLQHARGEYVAFLDNDGIPEPGWLAALVNATRANPTLGSVASRVMFADKPDVVNSMGSVLNELFHGNGVCIHALYPPAQPPASIMYATGNGMLLRREAMEQVGEFDEGILFYGGDDADYGMRLRRAGWDCAPVLDACVMHLHSFSKKQPGMPFWDGRDRIRRALKHMSWREIPRFVLRDVKYYAKPRLFREYVRYWWSVLSHAEGRRSLLAYRREHRGEPPYAGFFGEFFERPRRMIVAPDNRAFGKQPPVCSHLNLGVEDEENLYHGWYWPERWAKWSMRWAMQTASLVLELPKHADALTLKLISRPEASQTALTCTWERRHAGGYVAFASQKIVLPGPSGASPETVRMACALEPGSYRLTISADQATIESGFFPRQLGFGLCELTLD